MATSKIICHLFASGEQFLLCYSEATSAKLTTSNSSRQQICKTTLACHSFHFVAVEQKKRWFIESIVCVRRIKWNLNFQNLFILCICCGAFPFGFSHDDQMGLNLRYNALAHTVNGLRCNSRPFSFPLILAPASAAQISSKQFEQQNVFYTNSTHRPP